MQFQAIAVNILVIVNILLVVTAQLLRRVASTFHVEMEVCSVRVL